MAAGYSEMPLVKNLGIKEGFKVLLVDQPNYYPTLFDDLPELVTAFNNAEQVDFIHLFVTKFSTPAKYFDACSGYEA